MDNRYASHFRKNVFPAVVASILMLILFFVLPANASGRDGPTITEQPANAVVSVGESATFRVTAIGDGTLNYQWYRVGIDGRDDQLVGTFSTYETGAVTTENSGQQYYVIVMDDNGSAVSLLVSLIVTEGLSITSQPEDATVISGNSATFTIEAAGDQPHTYQWYVDRNTGSWAEHGSGESSYSTHSVTAEQEGWRFYVRVTGASGAYVDSSIATLHVIDGLMFTVQPEDARIVTGGTATFTANATGPGELTYQWYADYGDGRWSAVGPGGKSYTTPAVTMDYNGYTYMCRVFGDEGRSLDSNPASLTVILPSPSITRDPDHVYAHAGDTGTFTIEAQGDEPLSYLWSVNYGNGQWHELGETGSTYITEPLTQAHGVYQYRCTVSDVNGRSKTSEPGIVCMSPIITTASLPDGTAGSPYSLALTASGTAPFHWTVNEGTLPPGLDLTSSGILCGTPMAPGTHTFSVQAGNAAGNDAQTFGMVIDSAPVHVAPVTLTFDSLAEGYLLPEKQTVTVTNTGDQNISLYQPAAVSYTIGSLSGTSIPPGGSAIFTVVPKTGLAAGTWNEKIAVLGSYGVNAHVDVTFTCTEPMDYFILDGDGSTYEQDDPDSQDIIITANGDINNFTGLSMNGEPVDESNYDVMEGSTIVTLHHDFLSTLMPGTYTLTIHFTDGQAKASFVVYERMPVTGDNHVITVCAALIALSILGLLLNMRRHAIK